MQSHVCLALIGAVGGLIAGTVGLAGGIFLVPAIVALLGPDAMGEAIAVSFFAVLLNSLSATVENLNARGPAVYWSLIRGAMWYTLGAAVAAVSVAVAVGRHPNVVSKQSLAALQLLLAGCMLVPRSWYERLRASRSALKDAAAGSLVGSASTLIGVGGGTYTIFYFLVHGRPIKDCTLTANFVGIFIGLMSVAGHFGAVVASGAPPSGRMIDVASQAILIACGAVASPLGVRLQARVSSTVIKRMVIVVLALSATYTLVGT